MLKRLIFGTLVLVLTVGVGPSSLVFQNDGIAYAERCTCKPGCKCDHCTGKSKDCPCPKY